MGNEDSELEEMKKHFEERFEYDLYEDDFICKSTRLPRDKCECLECRPDWFRFKFLCVECKDIDEVIVKLEGALGYFQELKRLGYYVDGPIEDDYMEIYPPKKVGYYWVKCQECGKLFEVQKGAVFPKKCDNCDLNEDSDNV